MKIGNGVILFDGAMGTELQKRGCNTYPPELNLNNCELIQEISSHYAEAGSDVISTNTFGVNKFKLEDFNIYEKQNEIIKNAIHIAKKAAQKTNCKVAFDLGPTGKMMEPYGDLSFDEAYDVYKECAEAIKNEKVDLVLLETFSQLAELRAAFLAFKENTSFPVVCSMTFEENGKTLTGVSPEAFAFSMEQLGADGIGVNCSTGPDKLLGIVEALKKYTHIPVLAMPNAGIPVVSGDKVTYSHDSKDFAAAMKDIVAKGADMIGGCCGTTAEHIKALKAEIDELNKINDNFKENEKANLCNSNKHDVKYASTQRKVIAIDELLQVIDDISIDINDMDLAEVEEAVGELELTGDVLAIKLSDLSFNKLALERALRLYSGVAAIKINHEENINHNVLEEIKNIAHKYGAVIL